MIGWSTEEISFLEELAKNNNKKKLDWEAIRNHPTFSTNSRSTHSIRLKYSEIIEMDDSVQAQPKSGRWTKEEEDILMKLAPKYTNKGFVSWAELVKDREASVISGRKARALGDKYREMKKKPLPSSASTGNFAGVADVAGMTSSAGTISSTDMVNRVGTASLISTGSSSGMRNSTSANEELNAGRSSLDYTAQRLELTANNDKKSVLLTDSSSSPSGLMRTPLGVHSVIQSRSEKEESTRQLTDKFVVSTNIYSSHQVTLVHQPSGFVAAEEVVIEGDFVYLRYRDTSTPSGNRPTESPILRHIEQEFGLNPNDRTVEGHDGVALTIETHIPRSWDGKGVAVKRSGMITAIIFGLKKKKQERVVSVEELFL